MDESELREACRRYMDGDITKEELAGVRDAAGTIGIDLHAACRAENAALRTRVIELDDWMTELASHAVYERCTPDGQLAGMRCRFCQEESRRGEGTRHAATCLLLSAPVRDGPRGARPRDWTAAKGGTAAKPRRSAARVPPQPRPQAGTGPIPTPRAAADLPIDHPDADGVGYP